MAKRAAGPLSRCSRRLIPDRLFLKEELQGRFDAISPIALVVPPALDLQEFQIGIESPALRDQLIAQGARVSRSELALFRPDVQPDSGRRLRLQIFHQAQDHALIPPYRWRHDHEAAEDPRVFQS